ncbi:MAG: hypothetical protein LBT86_10270 [Deltaproteobacteria bacterium]|jgi:hypothetical protein|nr:hypothetical protein [Deltaproteobacteria bacterium]
MSDLPSPPLLAAMVAFNKPYHAPNLNFLKDFEEGRASELATFIQTALERSPRLRSFFPGQQTGHWDFSRAPWRLALLNDQEFERLALLAGLALWSHKIAQIIEGHQARALKAILGEELWAYALGRGRLQMVGLQDLATGETPKSLAAFQETGLLAINLAWSPLPATLAKLVTHRQRPTRPAPSHLALKIFQRLKVILLKEVCPSWSACLS